MSQHALDALEFGRVLEIVAAYATSEAGAESVRTRRPVNDVRAVAEELDVVDEMVSWLIREEEWAPPLIPDLREPVRRLAVQGSVWSQGELTDALRLLKSARSVRRSILPHSSGFPRVVAVVAGLLKDVELQNLLEAALDQETETLKDSASPMLKRLRQGIRAARSDLVEHLEGIVARLPERIAVPEASVTIRAGRYCIPIRREGRSEVGGIVHDESASRATLFVEPPSAIELMNRLRELEISEVREVERVLNELTEALRPRAAELADTLARLVELDSLFARAKHALMAGCSRPRLVRWEHTGYRVVDGRHPLLLQTAGSQVVPFDLLVNPGEYTVLVTGPNAGGKTVLLKAIGLIAAMTQAGFLPPVGPGSEIPVFGEIFADIGDEQSIDASLSTFTAHLRNLTEILDRADSESLCLIDEIGGATDPVEGTALAWAVLTELTRRRCMTVATSHLGGLKALPVEQPGIVSAGLGFDPEHLAPLYKLVKGRPGRSYALAIAQRIGFPETVLESAKDALDSGQVETERLLEQLEEKEAELAERIAGLHRRERQLSEREAALAQNESELAEKASALERDAHRKVRDFLLEARRDVDEALKADRKSTRGARSRLEERLRIHSSALRGDAGERQFKGDEDSGFRPGDRVWVKPLARSGRVVDTRGADVLVEVGGVKVHQPPGELRRIDEHDSPTDGVSTYVAPEFSASPEVHLRGMVAEEARIELIRALDAAVQAGLAQLRVIHGKGTGVLREMVAEYARHDSRVRSHRLAAPHEGGSGATVLELE